MKISKSKRQLAQLLIEAGVTQFPKDANWAAQDKSDFRVRFYDRVPKRNTKDRFWNLKWKMVSYPLVKLNTLIHNWHQTVLSRVEFDRIVAETAVTSEPQSAPTTTTPTLDQLLLDWRNADDYAQRKQTEADEAAAMRDERWQAVQARAGEMGVTVGRHQ